jgi:hypothetical protein
VRTTSETDPAALDAGERFENGIGFAVDDA